MIIAKANIPTISETYIVQRNDTRVHIKLLSENYLQATQDNQLRTDHYGEPRWDDNGATFELVFSSTAPRRHDDRFGFKVSSSTTFRPSSTRVTGPRQSDFQAFGSEVPPRRRSDSSLQNKPGSFFLLHGIPYPAFQFPDANMPSEFDSEAQERVAQDVHLAKERKREGLMLHE
ncbi:hypothetical protein KSP39_PZI023681 [Platanthera zijinensis]|uniref:DUF7910 domain-containing protein n=1 Tax=Platanthera zijinensis TaxID=2320716 RepID=A0AAP0AST0_9ASPA